MENIKFIREIMAHGRNRDGKELGNCIYYKLNNGNRAKVCVDGGGIYNESHGVTAEIVNTVDGKIDRAYFPFRNYFKPTRCSAGAPEWYQHVDNGRWYFSQMYSHVLPKPDDYKRIANAVCDYMELFS